MGLQRLRARRATRIDERPERDLYRWNEVEEWFLRRGMPTVARSSARFGNTLLRAAPVLLGFVVFTMLIDIVELTWREIDAEAHANDEFPVWYLWALAASTIAGIVAGVLAHLVVRRRPLRVRDMELIATGAPVALLLLPVLEAVLGVETDLVGNVIANLVTIAIMLGLTRIGFGAIFVWSIRQALSQGRAVTSMAARAIPMILLVSLFAYLSDGMWMVTSALSRDDLWQVVVILLAIAGGFVLVVIRDEMRAMTRGASCTPEELAEAGFPAAALMPARSQMDEPETIRVTRWEAFNATAILLISQAIQIGFLVALVFGFYCVFGSVTIADSVLEAWTGHPPTTGTLWGFEMPVSNEVVHTSLFLAAFSAVSFAASSVNDPRYRESFFEPLVQEVRVTITARNLWYASGVDPTAAPAA